MLREFKLLSNNDTTNNNSNNNTSNNDTNNNIDNELTNIDNSACIKLRYLFILVDSH